MEFQFLEQIEGAILEEYGDEEVFQIHIQTQQSWQHVTCRQGQEQNTASQFFRLFLKISWRSNLDLPA